MAEPSMAPVTTLSDRLIAIKILGVRFRAAEKGSSIYVLLSDQLKRLIFQ